MARFIASRLVQAVPVLLFVGLVAFSMFAFVGDPVLIMLGQTYTEAQRVQLVHDLGLDRSFVEQYGRFLLALLHGDLGISYRLARPVGALFRERFPATFELTVVSTLLALAAGLPLGVFAAIRPRNLLARLLLTLSLAGISIPTFLLGTLLILVFSVTLHWLPSFGRGEVVRFGWWTTGLLTVSGLRSLVLPAATLGLYQVALITRLARAEILRALGSEHVRFAHARGLLRRSVYLTHAGRNALLPIVTVAAVQFGTVLAFAIVTEVVFQWPGLGLLFVQAIGAGDIPVLSAYIMMTALVFLAINLLVDLSYLLIDPRLRDSRRAAALARPR